MDIYWIKNRIVKLRMEKDRVEGELLRAQSTLATTTTSLSTSTLARAFLQRVALHTQSQIKFRVTSLGTLALQAVFPDPKELDLNFTEERGRTAARIVFRGQDSNGTHHNTDPLEGDSGGRADISGVCLQLALLVAERPHKRRILILDEPIKSLNDPTRQMHNTLAEVLRLASDSMGIQIIIITMIPELIEVGERISLKGG